MKTSKGTKRKGKKLDVEEHRRYEEDGSSSDDEMPEVVSNAAMKEDFEALNKQVANLKQQLREAEKTKRRKKQEICIAQKKIKMSKMAHGLSEDDEDFELQERHTEDIPTNSQKEDVKESPRKPKLTRKVYPSLNVTVEPLTKSEDCRASAASDFKSRRLANVPRESIKTAVISYNKKLQVRK